MNRCRTCRFWTPAEGGWSSITAPEDPDTWEPMEMPFEVRICTNPRILFFERPIEPEGAAVVDGSEYLAKLLTAPDFGCVLHEAAV